MTAAQGDIAPGGDVTLIIGEDEKRLRVSSVILSAASSVFKALLGPHFREGQESRSATNPVEIALPEDASQPTSWLCGLLHYQRIAELENVKYSKKLFDFAVVVDKYDCKDALHLQSRTLLRHHHENRPKILGPGAPDIGLIEATYLLRDARSFKEQTEYLIRHVRGHSSQFQKLRHHATILPESIFAAMEWKRNAAVDHFIRQAMELARCHYDKMQYDYKGFLSELSGSLGARYWPPFSEYGAKGSLEMVIRTLRYFDDYVKQCGDCADDAPSWENSIATWKSQAVADEVAEMCEGICLTCVLSDEADLKTCCKKHA